MLARGVSRPGARRSSPRRDRRRAGARGEAARDVGGDQGRSTARRAGAGPAEQAFLPAGEQYERVALARLGAR